MSWVSSESKRVDSQRLRKEQPDIFNQYSKNVSSRRFTIVHIIYINSQIKDETELGKLMHDFSCTNADDMYYNILAERVRYFKEDQKGVASMCKAMEDMRKETATETPLISVKNLMKNMDLTAEQAMTALGIPDHDKTQLLKQL